MGLSDRMVCVPLCATLINSGASLFLQEISFFSHEEVFAQVICISLELPTLTAASVPDSWSGGPPLEACGKLTLQTLHPMAILCITIDLSWL